METSDCRWCKPRDRLGGSKPGHIRGDVRGKCQMQDRYRHHLAARKLLWDERRAEPDEEAPTSTTTTYGRRVGGREKSIERSLVPTPCRCLVRGAHTVHAYTRSFSWADVKNEGIKAAGKANWLWWKRGNKVWWSNDFVWEAEDERMPTSDRVVTFYIWFPLRW
jgi:hypothetical protein